MNSPGPPPEPLRHGVLTPLRDQGCERRESSNRFTVIALPPRTAKVMRKGLEDRPQTELSSKGYEGKPIVGLNSTGTPLNIP